MKVLNFIGLFLFTFIIIVVFQDIYIEWLPRFRGHERSHLFYALFFAFVVFGSIASFHIVFRVPFFRAGMAWIISPLQSILSEERTNRNTENNNNNEDSKSPIEYKEWIKILGAPSILSLMAGIIGFFYAQSSQEHAGYLAKQKERQQVASLFITELIPLIREKGVTDMNDDLKIALSSRILNTLELLSETENDPTDYRTRTLQGSTLRLVYQTFPHFTCPKGNYLTNEESERKCKMPSNISLRGIILRGFTVAQQQSCPLCKSLLSHAKLDQADLTGADLRNSNLEGTSFVDSNLSDVTIGPSTDVIGASFIRSDLSNAKIYNTDFRKSMLSQGVFKNAFLYADMSCPQKKDDADKDGCEPFTKFPVKNKLKGSGQVLGQNSPSSDRNESQRVTWPMTWVIQTITKFPGKNEGFDVCNEIARKELQFRNVDSSFKQLRPEEEKRLKKGINRIYKCGNEALDAISKE